MDDNRIMRCGLYFMAAAYKVLQEEIADIQNQIHGRIEAFEFAGTNGGKIANKRGRPSKAIAEAVAAALEAAPEPAAEAPNWKQADISKVSKKHWLKLTPKQRWAETARQRRLARGEAGNESPQAKAMREYWDKMTPEVRAAEMQRRIRVRNGEEPTGARTKGGLRAAKKRAAAAGHTEAAKKKTGELQSNSWTNATPRQRAQRIRRAVEGRKAAQAARAARQAVA